MMAITSRFWKVWKNGRQIPDPEIDDHGLSSPPREWRAGSLVKID
jgi:hypothetical protein